VFPNARASSASDVRTVAAMVPEARIFAAVCWMASRRFTSAGDCCENANAVEELMSSNGMMVENLKIVMTNGCAILILIVIVVAVAAYKCVPVRITCIIVDTTTQHLKSSGHSPFTSTSTNIT